MKDNRKHKRQNRQLDVTYSCAKGPLIIESKTKTKDISAGGIRLPLDEALKVADRVRLAITLPWQRQPIDAIAKVVWASSRPIAGETTVERDCGLEFAWTSVPDMQEAINKSR
ncbi:MAG: PilZ domain-containing protein [Candidatus Omnitrophota bacterium]